MTALPPEEWDDQTWQDLEADLSDLERTDPAVRRSAALYDDMVDRLTRRNGATGDG